MRGTRATAAGFAALTGVVGALTVLPGLASARRPRDICVIGCSGTTTATTSTTPTPPSGAGPVTVSHLTPTSATFTATYDTGSNGTDYQFSYVSGGDYGTTPPTAVGGDSPASVVSGLGTRLEPNERYTVQLVWSGGGSTNGQMPYGGPETTFTTPLEPAAVARITASRQAIIFGQSVALRISATGDPSGALASAQDSVSPGHGFSPLETNPTLADVNAGGSSTLIARPGRNMTIRAALSGAAPGSDDHQIQQPSRSPGVFIYVLPSQGLTLTRPENGVGVRATAGFGVYPVRRGFRGESVYFYLLRTRHGRARLLGHSRLRVRWNDRSEIAASIDFSDPGRLYVVACVRHAVVSGMGLPFTHRACGRNALRI